MFFLRSQYNNITFVQTFEYGSTESILDLFQMSERY